MSEWKEATIGEISCYLNRGFSPKYVESDGDIVINQKCIRNGRIDVSLSKLTDKNKTITPEKILQTEDILINSTGIGTAGRVAINRIEEKATADSHVSIVRIDKNKADPLFVFYSLRLREADIESFAEGSTGQIELGRERIKLIPILLPPLPEQKTIAAVISSLDDKIDILHRQNKTLEAMAETLFRQWFVEEAVETSEKKMLLGDLIETVSVSHPFPESQIIFLNTSDIYLGNVLKHEYESVIDLPGQAKKSIKKDDILFSEIRPANGRYAYIDFDSDDYVVSTKLMVLRSKGIVSQAFVFFYLTHPITLEWLQTLAEGRSGTFPQITFDQLKDLVINIPSDSIFNSASQSCGIWLKTIKHNHAQIRTLEKLRDTLLPKLMSGEVRVQI